MARDKAPSLLLLPSPPDPASRASLSAAYKPALTAALSHLKDASAAQTLIVAVACPILKGSGLRHKTLSWPHTQHLLAGLYAIISVVCANLDIPSYVDAGAHSVDTRVVLIDHERSRQYGQDFRAAIESNNTAIVDLATFASVYHPWKYIFNTDSEIAHEVQSLYLKMAEKHQKLLQDQLITVKGGIALNVPSTQSTTSSPPTSLHKNVCLGGTFDHLHAGHKLLLTAGAYLLDIPESGSANTCVYVIGITGDELLKNKKNADVLQPWIDRARTVARFLSSILELASQGWAGASAPTLQEGDGQLTTTLRGGAITIQCVRIHDAFGPTITQEDLDCLVVSAETRSGGDAVNHERSKLGWNSLEIFEVDVLDAKEISDVSTTTQDFSSKISSTSIRQQIAQATHQK
ncbi:hypothetical protein BD289DRAFT_367083 [Coniella lustricola]|uniref:Cytidyltransferase-like domain-containing protein n=1 Tax=Coniella lustricola TaxID=2025994 RepID=A0A2T3AA16_9PEZI|nr:hypothetical protein BD289DRAFT_367083 [Coniella lustricola]